MKHFLLVLALVVVALFAAGGSTAEAQGGTLTIPIFHFTDYHSKAVPIYSEGQFNQGGIARTVGFLRGQVLTNPNTVVFNGGDTMNIGSPSWSDKYLCTEWDWFNGIADGMAVGNHEFDYGLGLFEQCRAKIDYPVIIGNLVNAETGEPYLKVNGKPYLIVERGGVRLGVFAVAGNDYPRLIRPALLPPGTKWTDGTEAAKDIVRRLREEERVNAVISIGHRDYAEDIAMAQAVPGIDVIFGTHAHRKESLTRIPGTNTWYISPYQYLTYLSNVNLSFNAGRLTSVTGRLVKMDESIPEAPDVAEGVKARQAALEADPAFAAKFQKIGAAAVELSDENLNTGEAVIGNFVMDIFRRKAAANLAVSTSSSFRASIPPGDIRMEEYLAALPYRNIITNVDLPGAVVRELLNLGASKATTDAFLQQSGARFTLRNGRAENIQILVDPADESKGYAALDDTATYTVATTDFAANVQADYKAVFDKGSNKRSTGFVVNDVVIDTIKANSPVSAKLDGRVTR